MLEDAPAVVPYCEAIYVIDEDLSPIVHVLMSYYEYGPIVARGRYRKVPHTICDIKNHTYSGSVCQSIACELRTIPRSRVVYEISPAYRTTILSPILCACKSQDPAGIM